MAGTELAGVPGVAGGSAKETRLGVGVGVSLAKSAV